MPAWGRWETEAALEEDTVLTGGRVSRSAGRQTRFHLI